MVVVVVARIKRPYLADIRALALQQVQECVLSIGIERDRYIGRAGEGESVIQGIVRAVASVTVDNHAAAGYGFAI